MRNNHKILTLLIIISSCVERYNIEVTGGAEKILVVNASLTDEVKAHFAKISYSFPIDQSEGTTVSGASVWIEDDEGIRTSMLETSPGHYLTDSSFAGEVGKSYVLHITTSDGEKFISSEETLTASPPIDSIYGEFQFRLHSGDIYIPRIDPSEPLQAECKHFVECIRDGKEPWTNGENGLRVVKILEADQESMEQRGLPVKINHYSLNRD